MTGTFPFVYYDHESDKNRTGFDVNVVYTSSDAGFSGVNINGFLNTSSGYTKGLAVSGVVNGLGESKGIVVGGVWNMIDKSSGGNVAGFLNDVDVVEDYLIQLSILGNKVKEVGPDAFVFQVGLYNKAGNQTMPLINAKGWKNLFRKNKLSLEGKVE